MILEESNKVSPQPPLPHTKQPQIPQPLLTGLTFQALHKPRCPSLDLLRYLHVLLVLRCPKLNTALEVRPHQCRVQGRMTSLVLLTTLFLIQARMPLAFLVTWAHCWLMFSLASISTPGSFPLHSLPATLPQACSVAWSCYGQSAGPRIWSC